MDEKPSKRQRLSEARTRLTAFLSEKKGTPEEIATAQRHLRIVEALEKAPRKASTEVTHKGEHALALGTEAHQTGEGRRAKAEAQARQQQSHISRGDKTTVGDNDGLFGGNQGGMLDAGAQRWTKGTLDAVFQAELEAFVSHIDQQPVSEAQDLRAGILGFLATFAPESLSDTATGLLSEAVTQLQASSSYATSEWFRLPYFNAAQANLFDDPTALEVVIRNLSHGSRMIRLYLYAPLGLAIRRLDLNRYGFCEAMQRNFEIGHFGNDAGICLLLASRLPEPEKRAMLESWHDRAASGHDKITLSQALAGEPIRNDQIFSEYFNISLQLFSSALSLLPQRDEVEASVPTLLSVEPDEIVRRIRAHPLCAPTLRLL